MLPSKEHLPQQSLVYAKQAKRALKSKLSKMSIYTGLGEKMDSTADSLSGGQRRKLSVAIAFLGGPALVILDEPTSGMDPYSRRWGVIISFSTSAFIKRMDHHVMIQ